LEIAADIIEITKNGSRKTRIMYQGNLSFDLLQRYLDMLVNFQLIQRLEGDQPAYIATEKGRHFLNELGTPQILSHGREQTQSAGANPHHATGHPELGTARLAALADATRRQPFPPKTVQPDPGTEPTAYGPKYVWYLGLLEVNG